MRTLLFILSTLIAAGLAGQRCPADFTYVTTSCNEIRFVPTFPTAGSYQWTFGDGQTSTERNPTHIFDAEAPGSYTFPVTLITGGSCVPDTTTQLITVSPDVLPDPSIESIGIFNFVNCAPTDDPSYDIVIDNTSSTQSDNTFYTIDWGDGSALYADADLPDGTTHTYTQVGLYDIVLSVRGASGCWAQDTFPFFYGSNPGGNIVPVSNQIACVPEDVRFTISGTESNPPGTTYKIWVNDGIGDTTYFNHPPPSEFVYHLTKSPCESAETSNNYFDIHFEATNPCFTQSGGTIIRANKVPKMDFTAEETTCVNGVVSVRNESEPALYAVGDGCSFDMMTRWVISADESKYEIVSGSVTDEEGLDIRFLEPGEYTVTLYYNPRSSNACSSPPLSKDICVLGPPESSFTAVNEDPEICTPMTVRTTNTSGTAVDCSGDMKYTWLVDYLPADCGSQEAGYTLLGGGSSATPSLTDRDIRIRFDSSGQYRLGLVATNECGSDTSYQSFTVAEGPILAIREIPDTCMPGPITVEPFLTMNDDCSDPPTYAWDFGGGTGGDPHARVPGPVTFDRPGTYTVSVAVTNSCGTATTTETFEIFGAAILPTIAVTRETCASTSIAASLEGGGNGMTFLWTGPDGFVATTASWVRPHATPAMSGDYTVTATNALGCSVSATYPVVVEEQAPVEVVAGDAIVCAGESVTLTATGGATYTWTGDHLSGTTGPEVTFSHHRPGRYTVIVQGTDPAGRCDAADTISVKVKAQPIADAGRSREACVDQEIQLSGQPFDRYDRGRWSGDFVAPDGTFRADTPGTYTVTYTYTTDSGCSDSDQTTVCVREAPVADFTVDPTDACASTGLILRPDNLSTGLDGCSPAEVRWIVTPDAPDCGPGGYAFIEGTSASSREPVIELTRADAYTVTLEIISSCGTSSSSMHSERVMVLGTPELTITPVDTLCGAQAINFTASRADCSSPVTTYVWSFATATPPSTFTGATPPPVRYEGGSHTVSLTAFTACGATTVTETFVVSRPPAIAVNLPRDTVCSGDVLSVTGGVTGDNLDLRWTASHPGITFSDAGAQRPEISFAGVPAGTYRLALRATSPVCAPDETEFSVVVQDRPEVRLDRIADACDRIDVMPDYDLGTAPLSDVRWELSDGSTTTVVATTSDPGTLSVDRPGTYTLSLIATNNCGTTTATRTFTVHDSHAIDLSVATTDYCHDGDTEIAIINRSSGAAGSYQWKVTDATGAVLTRTRKTSPVFTLGQSIAPGTYTITAQVQTPACGVITWDTLVTLTAPPRVEIAPIAVACDEDGFDPTADYMSGSEGIDSVRWAFPAGSSPAFSTDRDPGRVTLSGYGDDLTVLLSVYGICGEVTDTVTFDRPAPPRIDLSLSDSVACTGATVSVTNGSTGPGLTYAWSVAPMDGVTISDATAAAPEISLAGPAGAYTITATVSDGACTNETREWTVMVDAAPVVTIASLPDGCDITEVLPDISYGADTSRLDSIRWTLTVLSGADAGAIIYSGGHRAEPIDLTGPAAYLFMATAYSHCAPQGISVRDTFTVNEPPRPDLSLDGADLCPGETITARDAGGNAPGSVTFHLFRPDGSHLATRRGSPVTFELVDNQAPGAYTLRLEVDNGACGIGTRDTIITVGRAPTVRLQPVPDACAPAAVRFTADYSRTSDVRWVVTDELGQAVFTSTELTPDPATFGPGRYHVTVTATGPCGTAVARDTFMLTAPPVADIELVQHELCLTGPATVTVRNGTPGDVAFRWSVQPATTATIDDDRSATPTFSFAAAGTYVLRAELDKGYCASVAWTDTVRVRPQPALQLDPLADQCAEATLTPRAVFTHAAEYDSLRWYFPGADTQTSTDRRPSGIRYRTPGTYTVTLIGFGRCARDTVSETFVIDPMPELTMGGRDTVCILDGAFALSAPQPAGGTWSDARGRPGIVTEDGLLDPVAAGPGTTVLAYTYASGACSVTGYREVVVIERPEIRLTSQVLEVCETETHFVLDNGRPTGGWYGGPGVTDPAGVMDPSSLGAGTYTLTYYYRPSGMTCSNSADFTVQVRPRPVVGIVGPDAACLGEPVFFSASGASGADLLWRTDDSPPVRQRNVELTFSTPGIHAIRLTATDQAGCSFTVIKQIRISTAPEASFVAEGSPACADEPYGFANRSAANSPEATYFWDFGNGTTSNLEHPEPVRFPALETDTTYQVTLRVSNACGTDTYSLPVFVPSAPVAAFTLSAADGCSDLEVAFDNQSGGSGLRYAWYIDGQRFSTAVRPPVRTFVARGSEITEYEVKLVVTNSCGADSLSRTVRVQPSDLSVRFTADAEDGCAPLTVNFRNLTRPGSGTSYTWDFGDGSVSEAEHPLHTFTNTTGQVRTYTVTLTADNGCAREQYTLLVTVHPAPQVSFTAAETVCAGEAVAFRSTSGNVTGLRWDFGDGHTEKGPAAPRHVYPGPGTYTVTLTATAPGVDCPGTFTRTVTVRDLPAASFVLDRASGCAPLEVRPSSQSTGAGTHLWDFGDGNTAVGEQPATHTYTVPGEYRIRLTVRDEFGCAQDTVFAPVTVHALPSVAFTAEADKACGLPQQVCFTNRSSGAVGYAWNFGNGETTGINTPCVTYTEAGTYNVNLTATSAFGCTAETSAPLAIYGEPVAEFSIPDTAGCTAGEMPFTSVSSHTEYIHWSFSDGYSSEEANFSRRFDDPGSYDVTVIVGNGSGCADTLVARNFVEIYPRPFADFYFDNAPNEPMNTLQFTDRSTSDAVRFGWDFGDGHGSEARDPVHRYMSSFDKTVWHWVENAYGCQDTVTKPVELDQLVGLFIHNIFTPDDNTVAEQSIFKPKGIGLDDFYIGVYSRTGQLVWESDALDAEGSPTEAWDGTYQGRPAKPGTYVWRVHRAHFRNGRNWTGMPNERGVIAKSGYITLLR
ncbi:PKD domain-containing protein [Lewinella sp. IMCC34183]|uniref:PKD domain-containing protein n=1 Tax=Lewinella sp. IMCC34183 TaxID=2248762 RepID=UPI000E25083E|nr:PKD domain-containing protein [Lewinella sp. IMCC34183]